MSPRPIHLINGTNCVACLQVEPRDGRFEGEIDLSRTPPHLLRLFHEFEEIVEGQILSVLDDIEEKLADASLQVVLENGEVVPVQDLQVYPRTRQVSFRIGQPAVRK